MVHLAIQLDDVPLAVIYRVVGEDDGGTVHKYGIAHVIRRTRERHGDGHIMRQRLDGYPRQFMPAEHVHVPRSATGDIVQERFRPMVEEPQVERVGVDMQTPRLVIQRSYLSVQIRHMASGIHRLALNQHRLACRVERGTRIEFAYRTAVQSCLGYMQVGVQQQGAEHAIQRCRTGDLTLCRQRLFRHRGETEYGTQIHILEPHH